MSDEVLKRDQNRITVLAGVTDDSNEYITMLRVDPTTKRLKISGIVTSGNGITSINADATAAQLLVVGTTGTDFAIVDNGTGTHTFNLPSASATNRGVVTTGSQTFAGAKTLSTAPILSSLTVSQILALDGSGNVQSLAVATYPSLTELSYVKGVTSAIQTQLNSKQATITPAALTKADDTNVTLTLGGTPATALLQASSITAGWTGTLAVARGGTGGGSASITLFNNITGFSAAGSTGTTSTNLVFSTSPTLVTPTLGAATATTINKVTITAPASASTLTIADGKTLTASNTITLAAGADSQTFTFPSTSATIARTDAAQTFTGTQTFAQTILTANAITASGNAATIPVTSGRNIVTNNSAATLTITLTTASAVNMQTCMVQILDATGVAQTVSWVNTENSTVSVPTTSNGSTTLPLTVGFVYNSATSKWRCVANS